MRRSLLTAAFAALILPAAAVSAQSYSDDQLLQLFQAQRDAFKAAGESTTGRTRGLQLLTVDDVNVQASTDLKPLVAPDTGGGGAAIASSTGTSGDVVNVTTQGGLTAPATDVAVASSTAPDPLTGGTETVTTASADPNKPLVFGALDKELQVNLFIKFGFDSAAISDDQLPALQQMCSVMKGSDIKLFRIVGHTDAAGSDEYNERLSQLRAREVARYLVNDCGIASDRLETLGLGERFLANPADPRGEENRRVEFQALS